MKKLLCVFLPALVLLAACKKDPKPAEPGTELPGKIPSDPKPRPVGEPIGPGVVAMVTPAGATITSADGSFKLRIPVGAVNANTDILVQEVKNTAPGAVGRSFELQPHGTVFQKPVTLEFSWEGHESWVNIPEALGVARQDEKNFWRLAKAPVIDKVKKTVSVQTTHFSNWALLQWLQLEPVATTVKAGGQAQLTVKSYIPLSADDLLTPLVPADGQDIALGEGKPLPGSFIQSWTVGGVGTVQGNGGQATYSAPATVQKPEIANVTATLKDRKQQLMVVSTLTVIPQGLVYRINGGPWHLLPADGGAGDEGFEVTASNGIRYIVLAWGGGTGAFHWDRLMKTALVYSDGADKHTASIYYDKALKQYVPAGGALNVVELGAKGDFISGSFTMTGGGEFIDNDQEPIGKNNIEGYFCVRHDL
ncbi:hypothetical protein ACQKLP_22885 [Chitinophaga sp. NPDC101104]|uniref:hypothetical protein n=1 Tax=Chitinophaga sp. NPDC101104 TaxID=3390561 RepID=UPI003D020DE4